MKYETIKDAYQAAKGALKFVGSAGLIYFTIVGVKPINGNSSCLENKCNVSTDSVIHGGYLDDAALHSSYKHTEEITAPIGFRSELCMQAITDRMRSGASLPPYSNQ
jgi:hypothetical protein